MQNTGHGPDPSTTTYTQTAADAGQIFGVRWERGAGGKPGKKHVARFGQARYAAGGVECLSDD